jgi:hypothetical protein
VRGTFRAVGTFETSGPPAGPVAAALIVLAFVSWLFTVLLVLAIITAVVLVFAVAVFTAFWLLRPRSDRDAELFAERARGVHAEQAAAVRAEMAARAAPAAVENHYHLHLPPGTDARGIDWAALPVRDIAEFKEN